MSICSGSEQYGETGMPPSSMSMWRSNVRAPFAYAIVIDPIQSWYSCVEKPIVWLGYRRRQEVDLVELQVAVLAGVERDAMVDCQRDVAVLEERNQIVQVLERAAPSGHDDGFAGVAIFSMSIQSLPSELAILMIWTPSSWHRSTEASSNGEAIVTQPALRVASTSVPYSSARILRVERLLDVADVGSVAEVAMDEPVHVAELQLDRSAHVVEPNDLRVGGDDLQAALDAAPMVVGDLEHEQVFEDVTVHDLPPLRRTQDQRRRIRQTVHFYSSLARGNMTQWSCARSYRDERHAPRRGHGRVLIRVAHDDRRCRIKTALARQRPTSWDLGSGRPVRAGRRWPPDKRPAGGAQVAALRRSARLLVTTKSTNAGMREGRDKHSSAPGQRLGHIPVVRIVVPAKCRRHSLPTSRRRCHVRAQDHVVKRQAEVHPFAPPSDPQSPR